METIQTDIVIVGAGGGGLRAAFAPPSPSLKQIPN